MSCSPNTFFDETLGHCIPESYEAPKCPQGYCANDGECVLDEENQLSCLCKVGFTGAFCETDIDECSLNGNACAGKWLIE